jgi:hypothetical protein
MRSIRRPAATDVAALVALAAFAGASCRFDPAYRDVPNPNPPVCTVGEVSCQVGKVSRCVQDGGAQAWQTVDDCQARGLACAPSLVACTPCLPGNATCDGQTVDVCDPTGQTRAPSQTCDVGSGKVCRGGACVDLCALATMDRSNVGCEYWGVDLDNADISASLNAAAQQYAIVVSNAEEDVPAHVTVDEDDALPGQPAQLRTVATADIAPQNLEVFKLGPREVDGSPAGTFNTGTGTALTRHAYRVRSSIPIVAYQFNPLDNVNVFSNDASQLLPTSALNSGSGRAYVVAGWPQTIATTSNPDTNFGIDLRAFLAIVGTQPDTHVHLKTTARVIPGGPFDGGVAAGAEVDAVLQPFEVLNLETGDFNADFTGTLVDSDQPIVVYPGSEASDAPSFTKIANRFCCADHLEQQATPVRAVGKTYVVTKMPNRTKAVIAAGGNVAPFDEPEFYRVLAAQDGTTNVTTTLPSPYDSFQLQGEGDSLLITAPRDFLLSADQAVLLVDMQASQFAAGIPRGLPGGDPSLVYLAPSEQWRSDYVLLTPDKYVFDYLVIAAPFAAHVYLDGLPIDATVCDVQPADGLDATERGAPNPPYLGYRCQLSYPIIDPTVPAPNNVKPGKQNDGVHRVQADMAVGVIAYGFDSFVSYGYAGGTQLTEINVK